MEICLHLFYFSLDRSVVTSDNTGLGMIDFNNINANPPCSSRNKSYVKWTEGDRYKIRYADENGPAATVRRYRKSFPRLNESTVREFKKKVAKELTSATMEKMEPSKTIPKYETPTGRPAR